MEEVNNTICRICRLIKPRQMNGYFPNGRDKIWIDPATGKQWNGKTCADCTKHSSKTRMSEKRKCAQNK